MITVFVFKTMKCGFSSDVYEQRTAGPAVAAIRLHVRILCSFRSYMRYIMC